MRKESWIAVIFALAVAAYVVGRSTHFQAFRGRLAADLSLSSATSTSFGTVPTGTGAFFGATTTAAIATTTTATTTATTTVAESQNGSSSAAVCSPADLKALTGAITDAIDAASPSNAPAPPPPPPKYQYKYLTNIDECTLSRLGAQGWSVLQVGSIVTDSNGGPYYAADCRTSARGYVDWAFFTRQPQ